MATKLATKLYVGGLSYDTNNDSLKAFFESQGTVTSADVILDKFTNRSRGFGFVVMGSEEEAAAAIENLNGKELDGRTISVSEARDRVEGDRRTGGGFRNGNGGGRGRENGGGRGRENRGGSSFRFR